MATREHTTRINAASKKVTETPQKTTTDLIIDWAVEVEVAMATATITPTNRLTQSPTRPARLR